MDKANTEGQPKIDLVVKDEWDFFVHSLSDIEVILDGKLVVGESLFERCWKDSLLKFKPHPGWSGQLEV